MYIYMYLYIYIDTYTCIYIYIPFYIDIHIIAPANVDRQGTSSLKPPTGTRAEPVTNCSSWGRRSSCWPLPMGEVHG